MSTKPPVSHPHLEILSNLPKELFGLNRFLLWKAKPHPTKPDKVTKVPFYVNGRQRRGILDTQADLDQLASLDEAKAEYATGGYAGIGFALAGDGVGAFDIDYCLDGKGELIPSHPGYNLAVQAEVIGCYMEISPSGYGLRIVGPCNNFPAYSQGGLEFWSAKRYITLTGTLWANPGSWVGLDTLRAPLGSAQTSPEEPGKAPWGDDEVIITPKLVGELKSALGSISSDDRDLWVRIGMALRTLGDKGQTLWMDWSATSDKFEKADAVRVWGSLQPGHTNYKVVFATAIRNGWVNPNRKGTPEDLDDEEPPVKESNRIALDITRLHPTEFILDGFLPVGVSVIAGAWGAGKSVNLIPLMCSVAHLSPSDWGFRPTLRRKVIWISEAPEQARDTVYSLAHSEGAADQKEFTDWFYLFRANRQPPRKMAQMIQTLIEECTYQLDNGFTVNPVIVLDTTSANLEIENESDNSMVSQAMAILKQALPGISLVLVGHTPKALVKADVGDMTFRGAGAWEADAVATYFLIFDAETETRFLAIRKCRFSPEYKEIDFGHVGGSKIVETPWGDAQSKSYLHGVPIKSDGSARKQAAAEAKAERQGERKEQVLTERQNQIMEVVHRKMETAHLVTKGQILSWIGGRKELVYEAIDRLTEKGQLVAHHIAREHFQPNLKGPTPEIYLPAGVDPELYLAQTQKTKNGNQ